ncbi:MAG: DUF2066 domain-containing protein [Hyphomicrobiaceae bacterium]|nr:DUF2066 domain-containing protein [Hyphomicrobiaceae bacterium]
MSLRASGRAAVVALALALGGGTAEAADVFTIAKYPVDATDSDAVKAKERAILDGQQAAFRALLKRLVPVSAYRRLSAARISTKASELIEGFQVRSETNSDTQYIASFDFTFQAKGVRELLRRHGLPFIETQAASVTLVPVFLAQVPVAGDGAPAPGKHVGKGLGTWTSAWRGLDLANTLTPITLKPLRKEVHVDVITALLKGDFEQMRILAGEYGTDRVVVAAAEPDPARRRLHVTLAGRDAIGFFHLKRSYRVEGGDLGYAAELAAVVGLGIIEGRWKVTNAPQTVAARPDAGPSAPVQISVEFRSRADWQRMQDMLLQTPGVADLEIDALSARGASVRLSFPGGAGPLALTLAQQGIYLRNVGGQWILRAQ